MTTFTVKYGVDQMNKTSPVPMTVGQVKTDSNLKAVLGWGDNVRALINGVEIPDDREVPAGCVLELETKANEKAN